MVVSITELSALSNMFSTQKPEIAEARGEKTHRPSNEISAYDNSLEWCKLKKRIVPIRWCLPSQPDPNP